MIATERAEIIQNWPNRSIYFDENHVNITPTNDLANGWSANVVFEWRWVYRGSKKGSAEGTWRDTWRIVETTDGLKIAAEHSVDARTGGSKD